jgi:hypothetical protein
VNKYIEDLAKEVLALNTDYIWDFGTKKAPKDPPELHMRHAVDAIMDYWSIVEERRWYRMYHRACHLMRLFYSSRMSPEELEDHFTWGSLMDNELEGWIICDCEYCAEELEARFREGAIPKDKMNHTYGLWDYITWNHKEYFWEEPTEEELLALGVKPRLVDDKLDKKTGAVQMSML